LFCRRINVPEKRRSIELKPSWALKTDPVPQFLLTISRREYVSFLLTLKREVVYGR